MCLNMLNIVIPVVGGIIHEGPDDRKQESDVRTEATLSTEELNKNQQQENEQKVKDEVFRSLSPSVAALAEETNRSSVNVTSKDPQPLFDDYSTISDILAAGPSTMTVTSDGDSSKAPKRSTVQNGKEESAQPDLQIKTEPEVIEEGSDKTQEKDKEIPLYANMDMKTGKIKIQEEILKPTSTPVVVESALMLSESALLDNVIDDITKWALELSASKSPSPPPLPPPPPVSP